MQTKKFRKDDIIFLQGDPSDCMYDIESGSVGIYADYGKPEETLLATLHEDAFFGEMGLIESSPRSATAVCLTRSSTVKIITGEDFKSYFRSYPLKVQLIMQHMSHRLRGLTNDYMDACQTVAESMAAEKDGRKADGTLKERQKKFADVYRASEAEKKA